jgi:glycosyltransferase involved in cell wall biosynthesis
VIVSVLIPSYRRPRDLQRCLSAIAAQTRTADLVVGVARAGDAETFEELAAWRAKLPLEIVEVTVPGQVYALNAGLARCRGDIVAITDDDAAPRPDWLARIDAHFAADEKLGGVGGRDWLYNEGIVEQGERKILGRIQWFGRIVGDHHLGDGNAREVDILKGANCAFRLDAIRTIGFDSRLRGVGAQVHNDMMVSLVVKRSGWRLVYDPLVAVDHYLGKRHDPDQRGVLDCKVTADRAFNLRLAIAEIQPARLRTAAIVWQLAVGTRDAPGVLWIIRLFLRDKMNIFKLYRAVLMGWHEATSLIKTETPRSPN